MFTHTTHMCKVFPVLSSPFQMSGSSWWRIWKDPVTFPARAWWQWADSETGVIFHDISCQAPTWSRISPWDTRKRSLNLSLSRQHCLGSEKHHWHLQGYTAWPHCNWDLCHWWPTTFGSSARSAARYAAGCRLKEQQQCMRGFVTDSVSSFDR